MNVWMDASMDEWVYVCMEGWPYAWMDAWLMYGWVCGCMDGYIEEWTDGLRDGRLACALCAKKHTVACACACARTRSCACASHKSLVRFLSSTRPARPAHHNRISSALARPPAPPLLCSRRCMKPCAHAQEKVCGLPTLTLIVERHNHHVRA